MKSSRLTSCRPHAVLALLALLGSAGTMQAANNSPLLLTANPSTVTLYCSATNPGYPATVTLKAVTTVATGQTYPVTLNANPTGVTVAAVSATAITPSMTTLTGIGYTFTPAAGCTSTSQTFQFKAAATTLGVANGDVSVTVVTVAQNFLTPSVSTINLICSATVPGPAVTMNLKAAVAVPAGTLTPQTGNALTGFTVAQSGGTSAITPGMGTTSGVNFTFTPTTSCTTTSQTYIFKAATTGAAAADVSVTVNTVLNPPTTLLANSVTLNCTKVGTTYSNYAGTQTLSVTSPDSSVSSYTVTAATIPGWLSFGNKTGSISVPGSHTLGVAGTNCGGFALGTSTVANVHLADPPYSDKIVPVTLKIISPATLVVPSSISMTYTQKSGTPGAQDVSVTAPSSTFFTVDTTTLPIWLTVDYASGLTNKTIRFTSTNAADLLPPGSYSQGVHLKVTGQEDTVLPVNIQINSPAAHLTVSPLTQNMSWTIGDPLPTAAISLVSSGSAIPYSIAFSGALQPTTNPNLVSGFVLSGGIQIPVTFGPAAFASAQANTNLNGIASITWGNPTVTTVVTFQVAVQSPLATLGSIYPASLATAAPGTTKSLSLSGTGFIQSPDSNLRTHVGLVVNGVYLENANLTATVVDSSHIDLGILVPAATNPVGIGPLPFDTTSSATVTLSVCNPINGTCSSSPNPGSTQSFNIGSIPQISVATSASAFVQRTTPNVAPYDILSLFGFNFCPTCSTSQVIIGAPDGNKQYPTTLSDGAQTPKSLKVTFKTHSGGTSISDTDARLLFATNNQINLLVPQVVSTVTGLVDIVVSFGGTNSLVFPVNVVATDPGIFTVGSDGEGDGAILDSGYDVINQANPAAVRNGSDSDIIQIYMSGLGAPTATGADNSTAGTGPVPAWSADCISTASFLTSAYPITVLDGAIIQSSLINAYRLPPCMDNSVSPPTVKIGNVSANVTYAGWVADSVAGLYQVNVQLPDNTAAAFKAHSSDSGAPISTPVQMPVVVTFGGADSQAGVTVWLARRLKVLAPSYTHGAVNAVWSVEGTTYKVAASEGNGGYTYAITSGVLPPGLMFGLSDGSISGTPTASGVYPVTVTATDGTVPTLTGTVSFNLTVGTTGLTLSKTTLNPVDHTAGGNFTTVSAAGGTGTIHYAITGSVPTGVSINQTTGVLSIDTTGSVSTPSVTITATDSLGVTGSITFTITIT